MCGVTEPHTHTDLAWDETWGLVQGPEDRIMRAEPDPKCEGCKMGDCPVHGVRDGR